MGKRGMGALEYRPAVRFKNGGSGYLEVADLVELAQKAILRKEELNVRMDQEEKRAMLDIIRVGTSAGGARAKAVIAVNQNKQVKSGQGDVPAGYTHWLIKLDGVVDEQLGDPKGYGRIEYAYSKMAADCGIEMTECRLLEENNRAHFMTRRFDRPGDKSKLHMQTLCGLCHYDYNNPLAYSYEQAFQAMRRLRLPYQAAEQLYRRMVFNVIGVNHDDHTKNLSFLMDKSGQWMLAPAYDLTYAFKPSHKYLAQHQLSINNKRIGINKTDLLSVAKQMNIKKATEIIEEVRTVMIKWPEYASIAGIPEKQMHSIGKAQLISI
jgi:serine/threonine-protein kinase HipA